MEQHAAAYQVGVIFGAVFVGILCGLIPLGVGRKRERVGLGWAGFGLCISSGLVMGIIGALPMAGLMTLVIIVAGPPTRKSDPANSGRIDEYDS